ncbi:MAG: Exodeoxyribonuclease 7 large subunit [Clostridia bacterium 41_269]|nr:MAG: Exodeoxyribonuclease 7 large subunit [Clostridia bacterium 41_269]
MLEQKIYSVGEVTKYIKKLLERDINLANVWVRGEISNFKHHPSGHIYFTLKDSDACLKCVMFKSRAFKLFFQPENGMEVIAGGYISVYEPAGQYQLYVEVLEPSGVGSLHIAFEQLKEKLRQEGLFDEQRKKPLPKIPQTIAVVTSPSGAAVRDVLNITHRRFPGINVVIVPTLVQGEDAPPSIARALEAVNKYQDVEVILLVRGGGSLEELWAFNTEIVARAIAGSKIPVVTGIGHETDFTIADFVADKRAPTPSAAAELVVPVKDDILDNIKRLRKSLYLAVKKQMDLKKKELELLKNSRVFSKPEVILGDYWQRLDILDRRLKESTSKILEDSKRNFLAASAKLDTLSPVRILARGYSICMKEDKIIKDEKEIEIGDEVEIFLRKGKLYCKVTKKRGGLAWKKN